MRAELRAAGSGLLFEVMAFGAPDRVNGQLAGPCSTGADRPDEASDWAVDSIGAEVDVGMRTKAHAEFSAPIGGVPKRRSPEI